MDFDALHGWMDAAGMGFLAQDARGRVLSCNRTFERLARIERVRGPADPADLLPGPLAMMLRETKRVVSCRRALLPTPSGWLQSTTRRLDETVLTQLEPLSTAAVAKQIEVVVPQLSRRKIEFFVELLTHGVARDDSAIRYRDLDYATRTAKRYMADLRVAGLLNTERSRYRMWIEPAESPVWLLLRAREAYPGGCHPDGPARG